MGLLACVCVFMGVQPTWSACTVFRRVHDVYVQHRSCLKMSVCVCVLAVDKMRSQIDHLLTF